VSSYTEISPCPDDLCSNEDRPVNTASQPARINYVMGNTVCDIIEVAAGKNCTPSASMSNLKCDPSGAMPGTVIPSVPDASVVNDCCTPSPVMPPSRWRSTTFALKITGGLSIFFTIPGVYHVTVSVDVRTTLPMCLSFLSTCIFLRICLSPFSICVFISLIYEQTNKQIRLMNFAFEIQRQSNPRGSKPPSHTVCNLNRVYTIGTKRSNHV